MSQPGRYRLVYASSAPRRMNRLPLSVAAAVHEHLSGAVVDNPHRLGKQLDAPYQALWSTRRADYRAIYGIDDGQRTVTVVAVAHRRDAYRP